MSTRKVIYNSDFIGLSIDRLSYEVMENYPSLEDTRILGLQPRGIYFAKRLCQRLKIFSGKDIAMGNLDATFFRDDFRRRTKPLSAKKTELNFDIEGKRILIVDDVLYTGRTIRAALSAINSFGRAKKIELLVLIDRSGTRELPIQPNYTGQQVSVLESQKVQVELLEQGFKRDNICIVNT